MANAVRKTAFTYVRNATGSVSLNGTTVTADLNSIGYSLGDSDWFGLLVTTANSAGTSPTLNITVEFSDDGGTTWYAAYPAAENSPTQAALVQITGDTTTMEYWRNIVPLSPSDSLNPLVRFKFDVGGTSPSFDITARLFWVQRG